MKELNDLMENFTSIVDTLEKAAKRLEKEENDCDDDKSELDEISGNKIRDILKISDEEFELCCDFGVVVMMANIAEADEKYDFINTKAVKILHGVAMNALKRMKKMYLKVKKLREKNND